jgi:hypothetical protein
MRRLRHITLVAALAAALMATATSPAHAGKRMEVAVQDEPLLLNQIGMTHKRSFKLLKELFVTRIRVNVAFARVIRGNPRKKKKPKHLKWDFASYDYLRTVAARRGVKLQLTLTTPAPAWANGNKKIGSYQLKTKYFKEFVRVTVRHFGRKIDRYAIHNEPNYVSWNGPLKGAAKRYRRIYGDAYKIIRKVNPKAQILFGETAPYRQEGRSIAPLKFIRDVTKGKKIRADGFAHHPYDFRHHLDYRYPGKDNVTIKTLGRLTRQLKQLARQKRLITRTGKQLPVYLTEYGYMGSGKYKIRPESRRAKYVTKAFEMARKNPHVKQMLQYVLVKPPSFSDRFDTSIVSRKGKKTATFKSLARWAKNAAKKKQILVPHPPR